MKTIIGTKETRYGVWQLTFSGKVLLDSEKFLSVGQAEDAARAEVARNPENNLLGPDVGYGHLEPRLPRG